MTLLKTHSPSQAAHHLQQGGLVAFPTETVYGLGADATNSKAIAAIFAAKQRPQFNPLITHVASKTQAYTLGLFSRTAEQLADHFWPGPLTLVLPKTPLCPVVPLATAGLNTIALRLPAHPLAQELLKIANVPIAAPSANPSGRLSPTKAAHILQAFKDSHILLLEGGDCPLGLESTVLHCPPQGKPMLLRSGALERSEIEKCLQDSLALPEVGSRILSPGQTAAHYAPRAKLRLNAHHPCDGEAFLAFGKAPPGKATLNLSPTGNLQEAAANLFAMLHELDAHAQAIAIMPIPHTGLGEAINDRLRRAATSHDSQS